MYRWNIYNREIINYFSTFQIITVKTEKDDLDSHLPPVPPGWERHRVPGDCDLIMYKTPPDEKRNKRQIIRRLSHLDPYIASNRFPPNIKSSNWLIFSLKSRGKSHMVTAGPKTVGDVKEEAKGVMQEQSGCGVKEPSMEYGE